MKGIYAILTASGMFRKVLFPASIASLTMVACTQQQPSSQGALNTQWLGGAAGPTAVGGSAGNTTTAFDGTYQGLSHRSASTAGTGPKTFEPMATAGCQPFDVPPTLTIANGLAQFQAMGVTFAGYVTPQGHLTMHSGHGVTLTGQAQPALVDEDLDGNFDTQTHVLHARVSSINCTYDVNWQRIT
jgi:hypothetical protein